MLILKSHFERVFAVNLGEVIIDLNGRADLIKGKEGVAAQCLKTINSECRQAAIFMHLRNSENSKTPGKATEVIGFRNISRGVQVVQPDPCNVNRRRRNCVSPHQRALLCQCRLIALEETATISYAPENTRDQLRIVGQTESVEYLILLTEI